MVKIFDFMFQVSYCYRESALQMYTLLTKCWKLCR